MITLFGSLDSGNVHKVQMVLARTDTSFCRVDVAQTRGEPRDPRFIALNPMGKVPALLRDDGRVLTESLAICQYLEEIYPEPTLIGDDAWQRAKTWEAVRLAELGLLGGASTAFYEPERKSELASLFFGKDSERSRTRPRPRLPPPPPRSLRRRRRRRGKADRLPPRPAGRTDGEAARLRG